MWARYSRHSEMSSAIASTSARGGRERSQVVVRARIRALIDRQQRRRKLGVHQQRQLPPRDDRQREAQVRFADVAELVHARRREEALESADAGVGQRVELAGVAGHDAAPEFHVHGCGARRVPLPLQGADVVVAGTLLSGMSTIVVTPPAAAAGDAVSNPSHSVRPGSLTWTCVSTRPGMRRRLPRSRTPEDGDRWPEACRGRRFGRLRRRHRRCGRRGRGRRRAGCRRAARRASSGAYTAPMIRTCLDGAVRADRRARRTAAGYLRSLRGALRHTTCVCGVRPRRRRRARAEDRHPGDGLAAQGIERTAGADRLGLLPAAFPRSMEAAATSGRRRPRSRLRASSPTPSPTSSSRTRTGITSTASTSFRRRRSGSSARSTATTRARPGSRATPTAACTPRTCRRC